MAVPDFTLFNAQNLCARGTVIVSFRNNYGFGYGNVGEFFCYEGEVYEILSLGGGGIININTPSFYATEAAAEVFCPCVLRPGDEVDCQDNERISEYVYFWIDDNCSVGDQMFMFLNKYGTYDYYNFRAREDIGYDVNKQEYKQAPPLYVDGWDEATYYGWNYEQKVWNNRQTKTGISHTGYIPKSDAYWLSQTLLRSPRVFLVDDEGDLQPIIVTNTEVITPNFQLPQQVTVQVEWKGAYPEVRQNK